MSKELKEILIRITGTQLVELEEKYMDGEVKIKHIWPHDLTAIIGESTEMVGIDVELPDNAYWYREEINKTKRIIIKHFNKSSDIEYNKTVFKNIALPNMLFGFSVDKNGMVKKKKVICVKDEKINKETKTYKYPFSNVYDSTQEICMGVNKFNKIEDVNRLTSAPYYILELPNNDDMFNLGNNTKQLNYRDLLVLNSNKEKFDNDLLVPTEKTVKDFIDLLKKE